MRDTMKTTVLQAKTDDLRDRSGHVTSGDPVVLFFYLLVREELPIGTVESLLGQVEQGLACGEAVFTNGWAAEWAKDVAKRLRLT